MLENLRKLRENAAISQKQLAEIIGVSQQSINKYENHNIEPDIETLIRIADYFDTTVDYLIGRHDRYDKADNNAVYELSGQEFAVVSKFRNLTHKQKKCVITVIDSYYT